ncbi:RlpA-like double-psi beta-barrel-protein domain-containing protein-containing protein [Gongronella butleri]|nr:RlpA-like double-psi beta-barrel-protein domain-containing protein-containing protein [Gongronella butleri]
MRSTLLFALLAPLAMIVSGNGVPKELNDMFLHHHPSQARKLAMAARAAQTQDDYGPSKSYRGRDGSTAGIWQPENRNMAGGYDFSRSRNFADRYGAAYDDDAYYGGSRRTYSRGVSYFDVGDGYGSSRRGRMAVPAGSDGDPVSYNRNGGIDWTAPMLKGTVYVDRGYHDEDFDITRNIRMTSAVDPGDGTMTGKGTYYDVEARSNACQSKVANNDLVAALNTKQFGAKDASNPNCGKKVFVTGPTGKSVEATIVDACDSCNEGDIDMSPAAFEKIGQFSHGSISIKWKHT